MNSVKVNTDYSFQGGVLHALKQNPKYNESSILIHVISLNLPGGLIW